MTKQKVALVTGAGSGMGRAVSLALNDVGYSVALAGRRLAELEATAQLAPVRRRRPDARDRRRMSAILTPCGRCSRKFARSLRAAGCTVRQQHGPTQADRIPEDELTFEQWRTKWLASISQGPSCVLRKPSK